MIKRKIICAIFGLAFLSGLARGEKPKEISEVKLLAEQGNAEAMFELASRYENGQGVKKNFDEAVSWYKKSAESGNARAQDTMGWFFQTGQGVTKDVKMAISWYQKAVDQGFANAQHNLAVLYDEGVDVPLNKAEAVKLYQAAAAQGHPRAKLNLGVMYWKGDGVDKDMKKAWDFLNNVRISRRDKEAEYAARKALDQMKEELNVDPRKVGRFAYPDWAELEKSFPKK